MYDLVRYCIHIYSIYTDSDSYHLRGRDELGLKKNFIRTTTFKSRFFNRIVAMWNVLPLKVRQASNISNFKKGARDFLLSRYE